MSQWAQSPSMPMGARLPAATVFGRTMSLVAATTAFFALGAYLGRSITGGPSLVLWIASMICLVAMQTVRRGGGLAIGLLFVFGTLLGIATGPTLAYYAGTDPDVLYRAGGATALTMGALGAAGFAIQKDLSAIARTASWALLGLIVFGVVAMFVTIPGASLIYTIAGMAIFAVLTVADFQRLRRTTDSDSAPYLAVSIFLDAFNFFMFFLRIFGVNTGRRD